MTSLTIFTDLTTEEKIKQLEANGEKYTGLYVDMDDEPSRKYVKEQASFINDLLKKLDRSRIDKAKEFKARVEAEAKNIRERLEKANAPYTLLIDEWNEKRRAILAEEKRIEEMKQAAIQLERDHEEALTLNRLFDLEQIELERQREAAKKAELERQRLASEQMAKEAIEKAEREKQAAIEKAKADAEKAEKLRLQQVEQARLDEIERQKKEQQRIADEKAKREADKEHRRVINQQVVEDLTACGFSDDAAKQIVCQVAKGNIRHLSINY